MTPKYGHSAFGIDLHKGPGNETNDLITAYPIVDSGASCTAMAAAARMETFITVQLARISCPVRG
jgi:hypothetical protein